MEGCPGCTASLKLQDSQFEKAKDDAKILANKINKSVAVFAENSEWQIMETFTAYANKYGPIIREIICPDSRPAVT